LAVIVTVSTFDWMGNLMPVMLASSTTNRPLVACMVTTDDLLYDPTRIFCMDMKYPAFAVHWDAPADEPELARHAAHVPGALAPAADEYVPAPQAAHVPLEPAPRAVENAPAPHAAHAADALAPAVVEYVPAPHGEQPAAAATPRAVEYVPAAHARHADTPDCDP